MRKFDLSLRSSRSSYFATFRHQLTILSKTDALDEEKWLNMLDRKSGSAGMPRPISYAVFCLKKKRVDILCVGYILHQFVKLAFSPRKGYYNDECTTS